MKKTGIVLLLVIASFSAAYAQGFVAIPKPKFSKEVRDSIGYPKYWNLDLGYTFRRVNILEVGVSWTRYDLYTRIGTYRILSLGNEFKINDNFLYGAKLRGAVVIAPSKTHSGGGIIIGLNATYYTDFDNYRINLRPEIGVAAGDILKLTYGYNIELIDSDLTGIPAHVISLGISFRLKKQPDILDQWEKYLDKHYYQLPYQEDGYGE